MRADKMVGINYGTTNQFMQSRKKSGVVRKYLNSNQLESGHGQSNSLICKQCFENIPGHNIYKGKSHV